MHPPSNQSARLYGTAKMLKFEDPGGIARGNIKFQPIIDQTGKYTYDAAQVISNYLKPLTKNECKINEIQSFFKNFQLYHLWKKKKCRKS